MKRQLHIELISDFILARPGRPFEDVQKYVDEIGASEEELKEAIFKVSKDLVEKKVMISQDAEKVRPIWDFEDVKPEPPSQVVEKEIKAIQNVDQEVKEILKSVAADVADIKEKHFEKQVISNEEKPAEKPALPVKLDTKDAPAKKEPVTVASIKNVSTTDAKKDDSQKQRLHLPKIHLRDSLKGARITQRALIVFFLAPLLLITSVVFLYHSSSQKLTTNQAVSQATNPAKPQPVIAFGPPLVYASQEKIDPKRIFSFPQSDITLRYTGIPKKEIVGFFPYWMIDFANDVTIDVYTTISLFGLTTDGRGNIITTSSDGSADEGWLMWNNSKLDEFIQRAKKKRIKVILTVKSFNNEDIETLVSSDEAQRKFISNTIQLINLKSLDGINIDFEYTGTPEENVTFGFTRLIANLNAEMKRQVPDSHLSIDTYLKSGGEKDLFDVQLLQDYVDAIIVMGYDVHTPNGAPGPVSPMEGEQGIVGFMQSYLERVHPSKLILALPYYGYDWPVSASDDAPTKTLPYAEIASTSQEDAIIWNEQTQTPSYQYIDSQTNITREVHFENARSLGIKYDYINRKNLQGTGVWAMGYEGYSLELEQVLLEKFAR